MPAWNPSEVCRRLHLLGLPVSPQEAESIVNSLVIVEDPESEEDDVAIVANFIFETIRDAVARHQDPRIQVWPNYPSY